MKLSVFTDGGARGNPGPAAIGVVIKRKKKMENRKIDEEEIICQFGKYIGKTTNNVAEYTAVVEALRWIQEKFSMTNDQLPILFYLDSKLVVNQLNGLFKIKDNKLRDLAILVHQLETEINTFPTYVRIPREKNWQADKLVNSVLDSFHVPSADTKAQKE